MEWNGRANLVEFGATVLKWSFNRYKKCFSVSMVVVFALMDTFSNMMLINLVDQQQH